MIRTSDWQELFRISTSSLRGAGVKFLVVCKICGVEMRLSPRRQKVHAYTHLQRKEIKDYIVLHPRRSQVSKHQADKPPIPSPRIYYHV